MDVRKRKRRRISVSEPIGVFWLREQACPVSARLRKKMRTEKFAMILTPEGDVFTEDDERVARISRKVLAAISDPLEFEGGMIVMSTDVNATAGSGFKNWARGLLKTWGNRLLKDKKIDEEIRRLIEEKGIDTGWSIGNLFRGRYYSPKSGQTFDEKSFSVDLRGAPMDFVYKVAEALRKKFDQESVMVINHANNKVRFVS
jgi:hypothetical protein